MAKSAQAAVLEAEAREPVAIVDAFHNALGADHVPAAIAHLHSDAVVFDFGGLERGKAEYAARHAAADAAFAAAVPSPTVRRSGGVSDCGSLAVISATRPPSLAPLRGSLVCRA